MRRLTMTFESIGIETNGKAKGKTICPKCHADRKNKKDRSLSFDIDKGVYYCHHCEWKGTLHEQKESVPFKEFFQGRGISPYTLRKAGVKEVGNLIKFNYIENGKTVFVKNRPTNEKKFWADKGGKPIAYNIDNVNGSDYVIITEGEMDALTFIECGYEAVVSPPTGANENLNWIPNSLKLLDKIYISVDKDSKGDLLRDALVSYFGEKKCIIIDTGDYKDINEYYLAKGADSVKSLIFESKNKADAQLLEELDNCLSDPFKNITRPDTAVSMINGGDLIPMFTMGNFSAISGQSKSGKTLLISSIVASALGDNEVLGKFQGSLPKDQNKILYFDTEQADYDFQWVMKRIIKMSLVTSSANIKFYRLREKSTAKRTELIDVAIRTTDNVGLVIIDGVRDLVNDINSPEESTTAINNIMRWTDVSNLHLILVLHQNPGNATGNKLRGHIGTEAMNKAETVISVVKAPDQDYSMVNGDFMRRETFTPFGIQYDKETNLPVVVGTDESNTIKIRNEMDLNVDEHLSIIDKLFSRTDRHTKTEFNARAKQIFLLRNYNITSRALQQIIEYWIRENLIEVKQEGAKHLIIKKSDEIPPF